MNVDEMPAGREMDALVAEKVMGQVPCDRWHLLHPFAGYIKDDGGFPHAECYPAAMGPCAYSTLISAAWEVVPVMGRHQPFPQYLEVANRFSDAEWVAKVFEGCVMVAEAYADTAPLAICRAALKAVGE